MREYRFDVNVSGNIHRSLPDGGFKPFPCPRFDGVTRMGRIMGKIEKKVWIRKGDMFIVIPGNFHDEKCDIIYCPAGLQVE